MLPKGRKTFRSLGTVLWISFVEFVGLWRFMFHRGPTRTCPCFILHFFATLVFKEKYVCFCFFSHCRCEDYMVNVVTIFTNGCTQQFSTQPRRRLLELGQWQVAVRQMPLRSSFWSLYLAVFFCAFLPICKQNQPDVTTTDRKWLLLSL